MFNSGRPIYPTTFFGKILQASYQKFRIKKENGMRLAILLSARIIQLYKQKKNRYNTLNGAINMLNICLFLFFTCFCIVCINICGTSDFDRVGNQTLRLHFIITSYVYLYIIRYILTRMYNNASFSQRTKI